MPLNPLDWTAGPFLTLYVGLAGCAGLICFFMRQSIGRTQALPANLDTLQLAYLAGGPQRVADAVAVGFMKAQAPAGRLGSSLTMGSPAERNPLLQLFRPCGSEAPTSTAFRRKAAGQAQGLGPKLEAAGLSPTSADMATFRLQAAAILFVPLALGIAKAFVGHAREKPIGILIVFLVLTGFMAFIVLRREWCTPAGRRALERARGVNGRAARAPLDDEMMLAVALSGTAVLAGTGYAALHAARQSSGDGGGGGGCGGGGGGCGGCGS